MENLMNLYRAIEFGIVGNLLAELIVASKVDHLYRAIEFGIVGNGVFAPAAIEQSTICFTEPLSSE